MGKEIILLGSTGIIIGLAVLFKTGEWIPALIPTIIGLMLIFFNKEESKIEERKDIKTSKHK